MRKARIGIIKHMQGRLYRVGKDLYGTLTPYFPELDAKLSTPIISSIGNMLIIEGAENIESYDIYVDDMFVANIPVNIAKA